jgi:DNA-binding Lrp family transcriptional regulator
MPVVKITDERLVAALVDAPSSSVAELAEALDVSEVTIRRHFARLSQSGALTRKTVVAPSRLGIKVQMVFLIRVENRHVMSVAEALTRMEAVHYVSIATGDFDLIVGAQFRSEEDLLEFLVGELGPLEGIQSTEKIRVLRVLKAAFGAVPHLRIDPFGEEAANSSAPDLAELTMAGKETEAEVLDAADETILRLIARDDQIPTKALAKALNLSDSSITRRIAKLFAAGVLVEHTILHPERLGYPLTVHFLFRIDPGRMAGTIRALMALPELTYLALIAGENEVAAKGHFRSDAHLVAFLMERLGQVPGIEKWRLSPYLKTIKTLYGGVPIMPVGSLLEGDLAVAPAGRAV